MSATPSASGRDDVNKAAKNTPRESVLFEAAGLITGDRNVSYGTPTQNFTNIAEMWTTRLRHKLAPGEEITATEVGDLMILLKIARNVASVKRDTYVDLAGYAGCAYEASLGDSQPE